MPVDKHRHSYEAYALSETLPALRPVDHTKSMPDEAQLARESRVGARFPCFDGLRAVAALSVFTFHFVGISHPTWLPGNVYALVSRLGQQGVGIFFVISGFLLYRPFVDAAFRGVPSPPLAPFWLRRFVRIFPAYWIALTAFVYIFGSISLRGFSDFVTYYGLLQNYRGGYALLGLGVAWTLVIEVSFYVALPIINRVARSLARPHATPERMFRLQIGVIVSLAAIGLTVRGLNIWAVKPAPRGAWFPLRASSYSLLAYLDWFAIGMAFAVLDAAAATGRAIPKIFAVAARHAGACWLTAIGLFILQARVIGPLSLPSAPRSSVRFALPGLVALTAGFVVLPAVFGDQDQSVIRRFLRTRPIVFIGGISYGIYLWHYIFVRQSVLWVNDGTLPDNLLVRFFTVVTLTLAVASASFYLIERPLISWVHRASRERLGEVSGAR